MAAGRIYTATFANVSVAAVQDLFNVQSTTAMIFEVHEFAIGQITATAVTAARITFKRFSGAYTIGSGGAAVTPQKFLLGDAAATATARANDTVQTTGGTSSTLRADVFNYVNGYLWLPAPDDRPIIGISQAFVVSLDNVPSTATMNATLTFAEKG